VPSDIRLTRRVQFYETDAAGIVHFSWFFRYMEEAEHALWRAAGLSIHPGGSEIGWPRVATSFEFKRPLKFEDEFEVQLRIAEITRRRAAEAFELGLRLEMESFASPDVPATIEKLRKR